MPPSKSIEEVLQETKIHQVLRPKLVMALPSLSLREAVNLMRSQKSGYLVIADQNTTVVGMFTEREVLMNVMRKNVDWLRPVSEYMRTDVHTLKLSDSVQDALEAMNKFSIRHIPLVDENSQVNGILSIRTIVTFLAELFPKEVFNLPPKPQIHETAEGG